MSSPWKNTGTSKGYLDILQPRPIPASGDDVLYELMPQYTHRPDLLAYDLYDSSKLWWVFAQRNMDIIRDPIYDMIPGVKIYLPKASRIKELLGE